MTISATPMPEPHVNTQNECTIALLSSNYAVIPWILFSRIYFTIFIPVKIFCAMYKETILTKEKYLYCIVLTYLSTADLARLFGVHS